jgi:protein TonB
MRRALTGIAASIALHVAVIVVAVLLVKLPKREAKQAVVFEVAPRPVSAPELPPWPGAPTERAAAPEPPPPPPPPPPQIPTPRPPERRQITRDVARRARRAPPGDPGPIAPVPTSEAENVIAGAPPGFKLGLSAPGEGTLPVAGGTSAGSGPPGGGGAWGQGGGGGSLAQKPRPLNAPAHLKLDYTQAADEAGVEGIVAVRIAIDDRGNVTQVVVLRGLGYGLDELAVAEAKKLRFAPARDANGNPISATILWKYEFSP